MSARTPLVTATLCVGLAAAALVPDARTALHDCASPARPTAALPVARPPDGGRYAYTAPEAKPHFTSRAVVHYVTTGADAPPLADSDRDGVPDYVETIGRAADLALAYAAEPSWSGLTFAAFRAVCDSGGGSPAPDVYVKSLPGEAPGLSVPTARAAGGAFALVSPRLEDPRRAAGVDFTTRHELFHLVQFAYVPRGMPPWIAEGTANALAYMSEHVPHAVLLELSARWYRVPWIPLFDESNACDRCYGSLVWWAAHAALGYVGPTYTVLAEHADAGRRIGDGLGALEQAFARVDRSDGALYQRLQSFAESQWTVDDPNWRSPAIRYRLRATSSKRSTTRAIRGLSAHYVPLHVPANARGFSLTATHVGGARPPRIVVLLGARRGGWTRSVKARRFHSPDRVVTLATTLAGSERAVAPVVVVTSDARTTSTYRLDYRACVSCPTRGYVAPGLPPGG